MVLSNECDFGVAVSLLRNELTILLSAILAFFRRLVQHIFGEMDVFFLIFLIFWGGGVLC